MVEHLRSILRISSAQSLIPDFNELATKSQVSDLDTSEEIGISQTELQLTYSFCAIIEGYY